jgi:hypothetical protein
MNKCGSTVFGGTRVDGECARNDMRGNALKITLLQVFNNKKTEGE